MHWQLLILSRIIFASILSPILFKKAANLPFKVKRQFWIYSFCVFMSFAYTIYDKSFIFTATFALIILIGLINSLAFYFNIRAINISQSRTSVLSIATDFIAIFLALLLLKETAYLNLKLVLGLLLIISSAVIFVLNSLNSQRETKVLFRYIFISCLIWGIIAILLRIFAFGGLPFVVFGLGWYLGSWLGTLLILYFKAPAEEKNYQFSFSEILQTFNIGLLTWLAMLASYLALKVVPLSIYEPFIIISQIVFPTLIGLFVFKEIKSVKPWDVFAFSLAVMSGLIIAFNY